MHCIVFSTDPSQILDDEFVTHHIPEKFDSEVLLFQFFRQIDWMECHSDNWTSFGMGLSDLLLAGPPKQAFLHSGLPKGPDDRPFSSYLGCFYTCIESIYDDPPEWSKAGEKRSFIVHFPLKIKPQALTLLGKDLKRYSPEYLSEMGKYPVIR